MSPRARGSDTGGGAVSPEASRLVLVRHGQTDYNRDDRWQGSGSDIPLNATGLDQARATAVALDTRYGADGFAALYASDLARASETARVLGTTLGLEVRVDPALRELSHGSWEGLTKAEVLERWPDEHRAYEEDPWNVARPGGDAYRDLAKRVWPALDRIATRHRGGRAIVVSHGGPIRLVMSRVLDRPLTERESFGVDNATWFEVEARPEAGRTGWALVTRSNGRAST